MLKNESKEVVFTVAGSQKYFCEIHPSMKGVVELTKQPRLLHSREDI
ncbi:MAG: hypothetical protein K2X81_02990 [Candidatus Obscuribacterales bacterium]|nr:hypothetical protein [Candidatus Obscuribacterales bacterium]